MLHLKVKRDLNEFPRANLNDFLILEEYFDKNIKLRLNGSGGQDGLKEAQDISTIITKIITLLNRKYNGAIPSIGILDGRKMVAKFIGLALFKVGPECLMKNGPNCGGISGPCCQKHGLEGLEEAHELFPKLFEPFGIKFDKIDSTSDTFFTSLLAIYADFKTQIISTHLILNHENTDSQSHRLETLLEKYYGPAMNLAYLKTKLQQRAVDLRRILEQSVDLKEALAAKFPADLFEGNLKNILRNVYGAYPVTFLSEIVTKETDEETGFNDEINVTKSNKVPMDTNSIMDTESTSIQSVKPVKISKTTANINIKTNDNDIDVASTVTVSAVNSNVTNPSEPSTSKNVTKPSDDNPFCNVMISGKFFRGILEPVDERFAAIIEGRDVNVKQYFVQRKKRGALINVAKKTKTVKDVKENIDTSHKNSNNSTNMNRVSLLDRHESAERISWDTQDPIDNKVTDEVEFGNGYSNSSYFTSTKHSEPNPNRPPNSRGRHRFTDREVANLIEGIRRFGRDWRRIQSNYEFEGRSNVDLKDKARNLEKLGLL